MASSVHSQAVWRKLLPSAGVVVPLSSDCVVVARKGAWLLGVAAGGLVCMYRLPRYSQPVDYNMRYRIAPDVAGSMRMAVVMLGPGLPHVPVQRCGAECVTKESEGV
jgi:hypothetical protein